MPAYCSAVSSHSKIAEASSTVLVFVTVKNLCFPKNSAGFTIDSSSLRWFLKASMSSVIFMPSCASTCCRNFCSTFSLIQLFFAAFSCNANTFCSSLEPTLALFLYFLIAAESISLSKKSNLSSSSLESKLSSLCGGDVFKEASVKRW